ncbi:dihydropyrimidinase, putative [Entamoeba histolytica HM-1:IMSS-B]|uniref:dihydropyrimidinase n=6 Tax=Entamoeba histolytica TaxID=5759 RepID=C4M0I4_ENTH1|nr:D-hydantoinase, putative [Entamoeba histolytica HM-1:IMSS]EMD44993.1 D-hydantoinase, putative [Entamoeba histolytica KU27]EMH75779.1 dihydropyrimidinase, putative [Entamoeba histolytica HM-1:IMSS-B]EMS11040.1 D-hydantoinase, putative [Entamoeba histolytica HM-3:IMSS]ENY65004.1 D-hydantoinase, putative [Entamoeba histolytica HM-1:IMSS-A]GAT94676.1 d-hydantoinase putative [Entamoeba histolytica]|eukprot:XP_650972.1 D-hydantoinase, putative [Entamoeba histolytica HM-1:IMSS]
MTFIIKNGTIITTDSSFKSDIYVKDGVIAAIGSELTLPEGIEVVDASGLLILPGAVDGHTHLAMPFGGTISADDYEYGTMAAACGGTTTVFDFALQENGENLIETLKRRDSLASHQSCIDYSFHIAIKDVSTNELLDSIDSVIAEGVSSFKVFMVYDFFVTDGLFYKILKKTKSSGGLLGVHAENKGVIDTLTEDFKTEGKLSAWYHYESRPEFVEEEAVQRAITLAKSVGAPLYIVHLSSKGAISIIEKSRKEGYPIFAETCIQYLELTNDVFKKEDAIKYVCSPPMKTEESRQALWSALKAGIIQTVATDHCPFQLSEKEWGKDDFTKIPNGCSGIENMFPYMLSEANKGTLTFNKVVEVCCSNPAKLFGIYPEKGCLGIGSDADIVLYDPNKKFTISVDNMHSNVDHTIWEGFEMHGYPVATYCRGKLVFKDGMFVGEKGYGKRVKCKPLHFSTAQL